MTQASGYDVQVAATLNRVLSIVDVSFVSLEAMLTSEVPQQGLAYGYHLSDVMWDGDETHVLAIYRVQVRLRRKSAGDSPADEFGRVAVAARVQYEADALSPEHVEAVPHFVALTGWVHVWPYVRAEVQALTAKLGIPPLTLPFLFHGQTARTPAVRVPALDGPHELKGAIEDPTA